MASSPSHGTREEGWGEGDFILPKPFYVRNHPHPTLSHEYVGEGTGGTLQFREGERRLFGLAAVDLHGAERFAHLLANRFTAVQLAAAEEIQVHISLTP